MQVSSMTSLGVYSDALGLTEENFATKIVTLQPADIKRGLINEIHLYRQNKKIAWKTVLNYMCTIFKCPVEDVSIDTLCTSFHFIAKNLKTLKKSKGSGSGLVEAQEKLYKLPKIKRKETKIPQDDFPQKEIKSCSELACRTLEEKVEKLTMELKLEEQVIRQQKKQEACLKRKIRFLYNENKRLRMNVCNCIELKRLRQKLKMSAGSAELWRRKHKIEKQKYKIEKRQLTKPDCRFGQSQKKNVA
nr:uncharacterized protein LOC123768485 [Procambarus clarkii]